MSKLHKRLKKHEGMSLEEKENCKCEMCKVLNVNKKRRKVEDSVQTLVPEGLNNLKI